MRGPEDARLVAREGLLRLQVQWGVPAPCIYAHDTHTLLVQPLRGVEGHAGAARHVVQLGVERVAPGAHEHDVERRKRVSGLCERGLRVRHRHRVAVSLRGHVEHDARTEEPLERELIDRLRALPADRRVVVPRRVDVRRVVRAEVVQRLDCPPLVVAQQARRHAEHRLDVLRALRMVAVGDVGAQRVGELRRALRYRRREIDERRHAWSLATCQPRPPPPGSQTRSQKPCSTRVQTTTLARTHGRVSGPSRSRRAACRTNLARARLESAIRFGQPQRAPLVGGDLGWNERRTGSTLTSRRRGPYPGVPEMLHPIED